MHARLFAAAACMQRPFPACMHPMLQAMRAVQHSLVNDAESLTHGCTVGQLLLSRLQQSRSERASTFLAASFSSRRASVSSRLASSIASKMPLSDCSGKFFW